MPFAVVETTNVRGCKELSVVPDKWLRISRNGSVVLWPNAKTVSEQEKLIRDENSCPKKSWLKYKCTIKRNPVPSWLEAKRLLEELSGESSSDVGQLKRRKRKVNNRDTDIFTKMLVLDNTALPPVPDPVAARGNVTAPSVSANQSQATQSPMPVVIEVRGSVRDEVIPQTATKSSVNTEIPDDNVQSIEYEILPPETSHPISYEEIAGNNVETIQYVTYESAHPPDGIVEAEDPPQKCLNEILDLQQQINRRMDLLEKRIADIATQNEFILDAIRKLSSRSINTEEPPSFRFDPIQQELNDLELKLEDNGFKSNMVKWLRLNVSGDCADNRMLCALDMLFSKDFQTQCTWTGASRKGPKVAIMPNRNVLRLFQQIGSDESEVVTQRKLAEFFMKKLKNSLKRLIATGIRRGTRHVRQRRQKKASEQVVKVEPDAGNSNAINEQADEGDYSCDDPESEVAGSAIDSSDALDHADIQSELNDSDDSSE
ncbi:AAEL005151-PA [Aedes aegypti]|uniref:AAEL005151-PA n=1 Tax=Aedes aegypti TaxID=7159 RepID=Q17AZ5_AEDAE|nr:AAEL005151-PA [Aedes aegypti]